MVTTRRHRSRSTAPLPLPQPPSPSFAMRNPQEEGRAPTCARSSPCPNTQSNKAAIETLSEDLHLEILSRVPAKSLCRFKCASKHWLSFVDNPDQRRKLPHSLAGFFYNSTGSDERFPGSALHFVNASGSGPSFINPPLAFLGDRRRLHLLDCCNGLVLCLRYDVPTTGDDDDDDDEFRISRYVVCNPATEKWVVLPDLNLSSINVGTAHLGFDPAASPHFHVFVVSLDARRFIGGVHVYSSKTRRWIYKDKRCEGRLKLEDHRSATVFHNGYLHLPTVSSDGYPRICAVDTKGQKWRNLHTPCSDDRDIGSIQQSQGRLYYASLLTMLVIVMTHGFNWKFMLTRPCQEKMDTQA